MTQLPQQTRDERLSRSGSKLRTWIGMMFLLPMFVLGAILMFPLLVIAAPFVIVHRVRVLTSGHPLLWLRARFGWGQGTGRLAELLGMTPKQLHDFQPEYVEAFIPKRSGGTRRLLIPDDSTKQLQRRILRSVLVRLRAHPSAMGFERGRSIVDNALPHVGQAVVIQLDVQEFFPATAAPRLERYFCRIGWNREAAGILTRLTTHDGGLPQGAPTSPRLSNLVNFGIDERLERFARRRKGRYTRYADDLTFSFPKDYPKRVRGVIQKSQRILKAHGYSLHEREKVHIRRRHQRQQVTGLVVNEKVNLPRHVRRRLRAAMHYHRTGRPATWTLEQLQGWSALVTMIARKQPATHREP